MDCIIYQLHPYEFMYWLQPFTGLDVQDGSLPGWQVLLAVDCEVSWGCQLEYIFVNSLCVLDFLTTWWLLLGKWASFMLAQRYNSTCPRAWGRSCILPYDTNLEVKKHHFSCIVSASETEICVDVWGGNIDSTFDGRSVHSLWTFKKNYHRLPLK